MTHHYSDSEKEILAAQTATAEAHMTKVMDAFASQSEAGIRDVHAALAADAPYLETVLQARMETVGKWQQLLQSANTRLGQCVIQASPGAAQRALQMLNGMGQEQMELRQLIESVRRERLDATRDSFNRQQEALDRVRANRTRLFAEYQQRMDEIRRRN